MNFFAKSKEGKRRIEKEVICTEDCGFSEKYPYNGLTMRFKDDEGVSYNWDTTSQKSIGDFISYKRYLVRMTIVGKWDTTGIIYDVKRVYKVKEILDKK